MLLSNQQIINTLNNIGVITAKAMPVKVSYAISKNITKLEKEIETYSKEREKLLQECGKKDDKGEFVVREDGNIFIEEAKVSTWNNGVNELLVIENEVEIHKFNISALETVDMTVEEIKTIEFMIEE